TFDDILLRLVHARLLEDFLIGRIQRGGGIVFLGGAVKIAQSLINMSQGLVSIGVVGIRLNGQLEFLLRARQVALLKEIFGFVQMLLRFGLTAANHRYSEQNWNNQSERDRCSHQPSSFSRVGAR